MSRISEVIRVDAPLRVVYNQWTQFESFPLFMEGVERVVQLDDRNLDWTARIGGRERSWRALITEQVPDRRIAWTSITGAPNAGLVEFESLSDDVTEVTLEVEVDPEGPVDTTGDALGFIARRVRGDLERFKFFIEDRAEPTGAWRGSIDPVGATGSARRD